MAHLAEETIKMEKDYSSNIYGVGGLAKMIRTYIVKEEDINVHIVDDQYYDESNNVEDLCINPLSFLEHYEADFILIIGFKDIIKKRIEGNEYPLICICSWLLGIFE